VRHFCSKLFACDVKNIHRARYPRSRACVRVFSNVFFHRRISSEMLLSLFTPIRIYRYIIYADRFMRSENHHPSHYTAAWQPKKHTIILFFHLLLFFFLKRVWLTTTNECKVRYIFICFCWLFILFNYCDIINNIIPKYPLK